MDITYKEVTIVEPLAGQVVRVMPPMFYWCREGDPKRALFYNHSVQGNRDGRICEIVGERLKYKNASIVFLERAFIPECS